ncbi:MAG TPA: tetratricopeptide repeat protein [Vicinamibacteria bacterium]
MAPKKESPIKLKQDADAAEKKGDFAKAIDLLKLIVQDSQRDWNTVNRIGDLYAKLNKLKEANDQYVKVARYFADDGFYLKAIAVWKKVLRNDPSMLEGSRELGDLYARQGLVAEARQTLGQVYDEYVKKNRMREAEEVLRRLSELDPSDFKVKGLLADLYTRQGDQEKAAGEYIAIADELLKKGKPAEALQLIDKSLRSGPRFPKLLSVAANVHIVQKDYPRAIELLEEARRATPTDREVSLKLAESYLGSRRAADARKVLEALLQRDANDQDARLQLGQVYLADGRFDEAFDHLQPVVDKLAERRQVERGASLLQQIVQRNPQHTKTLAKLVELYRAMKNDMLVAQTYGQMVEAYMATGGHDQAASILEILVQLDPHNDQHRTKLRWLKEQGGGASAGFEVDLSQPAPKAVPVAGGPPAPAPRAALELSGPLSTDDQEFISEHLAEGRVFRKYGLGDKAKDQFEAVLSRFPDNVEALQELADLYKEKGDTAAAAQRLRVLAEVHKLKGESDKATAVTAEADKLAPPPAAAPAAPVPVAAAPAAPPQPAARPPAAPAPPAAVAPPAADFEMDIAIDEPAPAPAAQEDELEYVEMTEAPVAEPQPEFDAADLSLGGGEIGSQYLEEEPVAAVEASFDLGEEPKAKAPSVPAELRAQPAPAPAAPAAPIDSVPADLRRAIDEIDQYVSMGFVEDARGVLAEVGPRLSAYPALLQRLAELGLELEAPSEMDELLGQEPEPVAAEEPRADEPLQLGEGFLEFTPSTALPTAPAPASPAGDGEGFDLASELGGLFGAQSAVAEEPMPAAGGTDLGDASLSDIFREFQKGVDKQLGKEDYETRYNLGIAYKEMGLVDEAIAEFQLAAKDERRLLECTSMLGMCFVEKGMPKLAVKWFEKGLAAPGRADDEYKGIRYDLGDALEQSGELQQALSAFEEVFGQDASFRDVGERIARLKEKIRQLGSRH